MPYISKAEQDQKSWIPLRDGVQLVVLREKCSEEDATRQIISAIADGVLRARWKGLDTEINAAEFSGLVRVFLNGSVHTEKPKRPYGKFAKPKIEIVMAADYDEFGPIPMPLLVHHEGLVENLHVARQNSSLPKRKRTPEPVIRQKLDELATEFERKGEPLPNVNDCWSLLHAKGVTSKQTVRNILKEQKYKNMRRKVGQRKRTF